MRSGISRLIFLVALVFSIAPAYAYAQNFPDLTADWISPTSVVVDESTDFSTTISNIGAGSTNTGFNYFYQIATFDNADYSDTPTIDNQPADTMGALDANEESLASFTHTFADDIHYYQIRACADKSSGIDPGTITESDENNNCGPWTDLEVSEASSEPIASLSANPCTLQNGSCLLNVLWDSQNTTDNKVDLIEFGPNSKYVVTSGQAFQGTLQVNESVAGFYRFVATDFGTAPATLAEYEENPNSIGRVNTAVFDGPTFTCNGLSSGCTIVKGASATIAWSCPDFNGGGQVLKTTKPIVATIRPSLIPKQSRRGSAEAVATVASSGDSPINGAANGSGIITPNATATYTLTCTPPGTTAQLTVTVVDAQLNLIAPPRVQKNATPTISWTTSNVQSCQLSGPGGPWSGTSGTKVTPPITAQSTYTLQCSTGFNTLSITRTINLVPRYIEP